MHNMLWEEGSKAFDFLNVIHDSFKQLKVKLLSIDTKKINALMIKFRKFLQVQLASL